MKRRSRALVATLALLGVVAAPLRAQYDPPSTGGVVRLDELLQRLAEPRRVLMIGAHPDDEDTGLLALIARGLGAEAAYLSLSRGEGGQNLIGSELGIGLGLLRSRELQAARGIDGSRQFFTRAYDFGYSKSLEETQQHWLPDSVLKDAVRIVRRFRPHVIVSVWSGTRRDRHGQHQMSGVIARQVFDAAGDASRYPELATEEGLVPWTPLKLFRSTRGDSASTTLAFEAGALDPRSGKSFHQLAMASRSQHRSQDMGVLQEIGPRVRGLALWEDRTGAGDGSLFAGVPIDHAWLGEFAKETRGRLSARAFGEVVPALARTAERARGQGVPPARLELLDEAIGVAASVLVDAVVSEEVAVAGGEVEVELRVHNAGSYPIDVVGVTVGAPAGWVVETVDAPGAVPPTEARDVVITVRAPPDAPVTRPYFLVDSLAGALYDWSNAPPEVRGEPFQPELLSASVRLEVAGVEFTLERPVTYRYRDQAFGERRRAFRVVPAVDVRLVPDAVVWSTTSGPEDKTFTVTLRSNVDEPIRGRVAIEGTGWELPDARTFALERFGEQRAYEFTLSRPYDARADRGTVIARATPDGGTAIHVGVAEISYPHIDPVAWVRPAAATVTLAPIELPSIDRVGYVRGASDRVPEALAEIGLDVELLDEEALARGDLAAFEVIVIGSRAYEVRDDLVRHNDRVLDYVRDGGHLVVQYQQYQFVRGGYAPYPLRIEFPHHRVTDETAPVAVLDPTHPIMSRPNVIGERDWEGWPHERGLYFAAEWDDAYVPLLAMADTGEDPLEGSLLAARVGQGTYIYTGISFFRVLPAGTPGAYRLFLNMLQPGW